MPAQSNVYAAAASHDGGLIRRQDGGESWQAMLLPGEVKDVYVVACG